MSLTGNAYQADLVKRLIAGDPDQCHLSQEYKLKHALLIAHKSLVWCMRYMQHTIREVSCITVLWHGPDLSRGSNPREPDRARSDL